MSGAACSTLNCDKPYMAKGYCNTCYARVRYAEPEFRRARLEANHRAYRKFAPARTQRGRRYAKERKGERKHDLGVFVSLTYTRMRDRVFGKSDKSVRFYSHLPILSREEFYKWAHSSPELVPMFNAWVSSGNILKLTPTVDRIDSNEGYIIRNMQWLTFSENSSKATRYRFTGVQG